MFKKEKGFTLIELLVVIAIIGILSSVVLASLNSARTKGADAAVKSNLSNIRAQAELSGDGVYTAICTNTEVAKMKQAAETAGGTAGVCFDNNATWAVSVPLKTSGKSWCVDYKGSSKEITTATAPTEASQVCP